MMRSVFHVQATTSLMTTEDVSESMMSVSTGRSVVSAPDAPMGGSLVEREDVSRRFLLRLLRVNEVLESSLNDLSLFMFESFFDIFSAILSYFYFLYLLFYILKLNQSS